MNSQNRKRIRRLWFPFFILLNLFTYATVSRAATILVATGPGPGHLPIVRVTVNDGANNETISFMAYPVRFMGGVRVAVGDVNGDGVADIITAAGAGAPPHVKVFDGRSLGRRGSLLMSFNAFPGFFRGGVYVAAGDVNGDGRADIIVGPEGAPPLVRVFDGNTGDVLTSFLAYPPTFTGGVRVAAGDVNNDGHADIITGAGAGVPGGHVRVFDGLTGQQLNSFFAFTGFNGGVFVAAGDVNGDGHDDLIVGAGPGTPGGHVKVFDAVSNQTLLSFFAFDPSFSGGVRVAAGDVNGDNLADIITGAGPGAGPHVKVFRAPDLVVLHNFLAYEASFQGGVFVGGGTPRARR